MVVALYSGIISILEDPLYYTLNYNHFIDVYRTTIMDSLSLKETPIDETNPLVHAIDEFIRTHALSASEETRYFLFLKNLNKKKDEVEKEISVDPSNTEIMEEVLVCTKGYFTLFLFPVLLNNLSDKEHFIREFLKITDNAEINSLGDDLMKETLAYHYYAFPFKPVYYVPFTGIALPSSPLTLLMMENIFKKFKNRKKTEQKDEEGDKTDGEIDDSYIFECSVHGDFSFFTMLSTISFPAETREEVLSIVQWGREHISSLRDEMISSVAPLQ